MQNTSGGASQPSLSAKLQAEQEMLLSLLSPGDAYPWTPAHAEAYFEGAMADHELTLSDEEASSGWNAMAAALSAVWTPSLQETLHNTFARRLSADLINTISLNAARLVNSGRPLAEQLIACVSDTLTDWQETDLQVMARPLAHAMRGQEEILEATVQSVRNVEWEQLSPMEQARISLAAARYAIDYLQDDNS